MVPEAEKPVFLERFLAGFPKWKYFCHDWHDSTMRIQTHLTFERVKTSYDHPFAFDTDLMLVNQGALGWSTSGYSHLRLYGAYPQQKDYRPGASGCVHRWEVSVPGPAPTCGWWILKFWLDWEWVICWIIRRIKRDMEERGRSLDSVIEQYLGVVKLVSVRRADQALCGCRIQRELRNKVAIDWLRPRLKKILKEVEKLACFLLCHWGNKVCESGRCSSYKIFEM